VYWDWEDKFDDLGVNITYNSDNVPVYNVQLAFISANNRSENAWDA
jgi:hypothetical protein